MMMQRQCDTTPSQRSYQNVSAETTRNHLGTQSCNKFQIFNYTTADRDARESETCDELIYFYSAWKSTTV